MNAQDQQQKDPSVHDHFDVVLIGGGLAGLSLARHLLLETDKKILMLERRTELPSRRQKVGESTVQLGGYYFSRVLDLEEYLWLNHLMKYNLRFYWKTTGRDNSRFEDYSQGYIRKFSNIPSYQLDRNTFEKELLDRNLESANFVSRLGIKDLDVQLSESGGQHQVRFTADGQPCTIDATWVIDTTGRNKVMAKRMELRKENPINHAAFFWWVDGLVDIDQLTDLSRSEIRMKKERRHQGHLPTWLATNHFCEEGLWFWVIPLQGKTSLGLVFDKDLVDFEFKDVNSPEKATKWVCEHFPCFARDLPQREVLDYGGYADFSYDCERTINPSRWAISGEAGRFSDPLYSPGSDLIAIYNTLIVDCILTDDQEQLEAKCRMDEQLMRAVYQAYVPTYATSYNALGDAEVFSLKYTWELTVYFAGYVFPFINDLLTNRRFAYSFMRLFARLGPINACVQQYLADYYRWKKENMAQPEEPVFHDFSSLGPLAEAEKTFYEVGVSVEEGKEILTRQVQNLEEMGRFLVAWISSMVLDDERAVTNERFVQSIDIYDVHFDADAIHEQWNRCKDDEAQYQWSFDHKPLDHFRQARRALPANEQKASAASDGKPAEDVLQNTALEDAVLRRAVHEEAVLQETAH